jgi:hypothetical protein
MHPEGQKKTVNNFNFLSVSLAVIRKAAMLTLKAGFLWKSPSLKRNPAVG